MENGVVAEAFEAINAALATLNAAVADTSPGASSAGDPLYASADQCLDILSGVARSEGKFAALKAQAAVKFSNTVSSMAAPDVPGQGAVVREAVAQEMAQEMAVTAEIACVLTIGARAAGDLLAQAHQLTTTLPLTLAALQAGNLSWQHAKAMIEETTCLDPAGTAALEAHFLDPDAPNPAHGATAGEMPAGRLRARARTWRERHHTDSIEKRHTKSVLDRRVDYTPDADGMAWLSAYLPADTASAIWNRTTAISRGLQGPTETRTLTQRRADVFATALLGSGTGEGLDPGQVPPPRAQVLVTVPMFSLLGATDEPAMLDGYGPIPASMAQDLVADGADSFYRVLVDPRDGAPLEIGRTSYRLTKAMRNWLRLRDAECPFPGCTNHSLDNEADHLLAWHQGGTTGISNLGQPCPAHHRLKHTSTWTPTPATKNEPPGWTSPFGRHYKSEHQDWEPPTLPAALTPGLQPKKMHPNGMQPDRLYPNGLYTNRHGRGPAPRVAQSHHPGLDHTRLSPGEHHLEWLLHAPG